MVAWLYGVGRNAIAAEARRRARELHAARRIEGRRLVDGASFTRIEERLDAERSSRRMYRAIAELPEADRALLELVALDGLSVADAARALGVKPATARVRLHRSRARVTARLHEPGAPSSPDRALPWRSAHERHHPARLVRDRTADRAPP